MNTYVLFEGCFVFFVFLFAFVQRLFWGFFPYQALFDVVGRANSAGCYLQLDEKYRKKVLQ